jgi:hypothetical protein
VVGLVSDAGVEAGGGIVPDAAGVVVATGVAVTVGVVTVALPSVFAFEISLGVDEQASPAVAMQAEIIR